jgi:hypothetical protein
LYQDKVFSYELKADEVDNDPEIEKAKEASKLDQGLVTKYIIGFAVVLFAYVKTSRML